MQQDRSAHVIPGLSNCLIDGFRHSLESISDFRQRIYFLTHFHSDHYTGLHSGWKAGHIFCTPTTARLLINIMKVKRVDLIHPVEIGESINIKGAEVTFLDANHCPGAAMLLFKLDSGVTFLHTGDMRYHPRMKEYKPFHSVAIDKIFLDTTYAHPKHQFKSQSETIEEIVRKIRDFLRLYEDSGLVYLSAYNLGKERVIFGVQDALKLPIYMDEDKIAIMNQIEGGPERVAAGMFTSDPLKANIHVCGMNLAGFVGQYFKANFDSLEYHRQALNELKAKTETMAHDPNLQLKPFTHVLHFLPTGWAESSSYNRSHSYQVNGHLGVQLVAYSEHSQYEELMEFVRFLKPREIVPTVYADERNRVFIVHLFRNLVDKKQNMQRFIDRFKSSPSNSGKSSTTSRSPNVSKSTTTNSPITLMSKEAFFKQEQKAVSAPVELIDLVETGTSSSSSNDETDMNSTSSGSQQGYSAPSGGTANMWMKFRNLVNSNSVHVGENNSSSNNSALGGLSCPPLTLSVEIATDHSSMQSNQQQEQQQQQSSSWFVGTSASSELSAGTAAAILSNNNLASLLPRPILTKLPSLRSGRSTPAATAAATASSSSLATAGGLNLNLVVSPSASPNPLSLSSPVQFLHHPHQQPQQQYPTLQFPFENENKSNNSSNNNSSRGREEDTFSEQMDTDSPMANFHSNHPRINKNDGTQQQEQQQEQQRYVARKRGASEIVSDKISQELCKTLSASMSPKMYVQPDAGIINNNVHNNIHHTHHFYSRNNPRLYHGTAAELSSDGADNDEEDEDENNFDEEREDHIYSGAHSGANNNHVRVLDTRKKSGDGVDVMQFGALRSYSLDEAELLAVDAHNNNNTSSNSNSFPVFSSASNPYNLKPVNTVHNHHNNANNSSSSSSSVIAVTSSTSSSSCTPVLGLLNVRSRTSSLSDNNSNPVFDSVQHYANSHQHILLLPPPPHPSSLHHNYQPLSADKDDGPLLRTPSSKKMKLSSTAAAVCATATDATSGSTNHHHNDGDDHDDINSTNMPPPPPPPPGLLNSAVLAPENANTTSGTSTTTNTTTYHNNSATVHTTMKSAPVAGCSTSSTSVSSVISNSCSSSTAAGDMGPPLSSTANKNPPPPSSSSSSQTYSIPSTPRGRKAPPMSSWTTYTTSNAFTILNNITTNTNTITNNNSMNSSGSFIDVHPSNNSISMTHLGIGLMSGESFYEEAKDMTGEEKEKEEKEEKKKKAEQMVDGHVVVLCDDEESAIESATSAVTAQKVAVEGGGWYVNNNNNNHWTCARCGNNANVDMVGGNNTTAVSTINHAMFLPPLTPPKKLAGTSSSTTITPQQQHQSTSKKLSPSAILPPKHASGSISKFFYNNNTTNNANNNAYNNTNNNNHQVCCAKCQHPKEEIVHHGVIEVVSEGDIIDLVD